MNRPAFPPGTASSRAAPAFDDGFAEIMALAIEGGGTGLWDRNVVTGEIRYSPGWKAILGYRPDELSNRIEEAYTRVHPDDLSYVRTSMEAHFAGRTESYEVEHRLRCKDGSWKWVLSRGRVIARDACGRALRMVGTTTDLTATRTLAERLRQAEVELREQRELLIQAQKMEAIGQLTGGLAHDFNNMLAGITGNLEMLRARLAQGRLETINHYVTAALEGTARAAALTHRLLTFARRQTLDPRPTDPNLLIAGMKDLVQRTVGPEIRVETRLAAGIWRILCDPPQLESAILNLCINARDAMPAGGHITIATANVVLSEESAPRHAMPVGHYVLMSIADTGCGMPPEVVARAFDPFFTTKPDGQGTGLGLSMVYGFARQSGGLARIESDPGAGTTVRLYLPRSGDDHVREAERAVPDGTGRAQAGWSVLVVDDEPMVRVLVAEMAEELGCRPIAAADGPAAMQVLQSGVPIDLLITDVRMPGGLTGPELAARARQFRPDLVVLFITGYAEDRVLAGGHLAPGMHVLAKPFTLETFAAKLDAIAELQRRQSHPARPPLPAQGLEA